jgi:hypothetical protein
MIAEILALETAETAAHAVARPDMNSPSPYANRPWVEFVMGQMLLLFGADRASSVSPAAPR